jgi:Sulfotransferase family
MIERPIFVVGYARSGTTLLQSLLGAHPRIAAAPEVHFWLRIVELADYWGDLHDDARAHDVVRELLHPPVGLLDDAGIDDGAVLTTFLHSDRSYAALLDSLMTAIAQRQDKPRWSEKSPQQRPSWIWSLMPDAQILHIVRDPRDVAASESTWWRGTPAWRSAEQCSDFTRNAVNDAASQPSGRYLRIRYEDLTAHPAAVMRSVCDFLGEAFPPDLTTVPRAATTAVPRETTPWQVEATQPIRPARSRWTAELDWRSRALVAAATVDVVRQLDYPQSPGVLTAAGRALRPTTWPRRRLEAHRRQKIGRTARTPAERRAAIHALMADAARRSQGSSSAGR